MSTMSPPRARLTSEQREAVRLAVDNRKRAILKNYPPEGEIKRVERDLELDVERDALQSSIRIEDPAPAVTLRARQVEILTLLADGNSTTEIARLLTLDPKTVRSHVRDATRRLGAKNACQGVVLAFARRLISPTV